MKKPVVIISLICVFLIVVFSVLKARFTDTVKVIEVEKGKAVDAVAGTVEVFANIDLKLESETEGRLVEVLVDLGDFVKKGDIIARIESEEVRHRLQQNLVKLEAAKKRLSLPYSREFDVVNVEGDIARITQLVQGGAASKVELDRKNRELEIKKAGLEEEKIGRKEHHDILEAEVARLRARLKYCDILAPHDGEIAEILAFAGDYIYRGNEVVRLISPGRWVQMTLSEEDFYGVSLDQTATVYLASYPHQRFEAKVTGKASFADSDAKTRNLFLGMDLPDDMLIPGLTGQAVLVKHEREGNIVIPRRGLIGSSVYVVDGGEVEIRSVQVGFRSLDKAEILEGLSVGDKLILDNQSLLHSGDEVSIEILN